MQITLDLVKLWSRKDCTHLHSHGAQDCPFYRIWLTLSAGIYFSLWQWHFVMIWTAVSLFSENEPFSTHCRPFNSLLCELCVPAAWQLNLLPNFCSSPEDHKALYNFIPLHWVFSDGWLLLKEWVIPKNVILIWFLTEKSYMFRRMLPRPFSKTHN